MVGRIGSGVCMPCGITPKVRSLDGLTRSAGRGMTKKRKEA